MLPRRLEPVFTALAGNIANHDYKAAQRLALFIVEVDKKIGTPAVKRIVQRARKEHENFVLQPGNGKMI